MFGKFSQEARLVLINAKKEMVDLKHPYVGSEHLLLSILSTNNSLKDKLNSYNITYDVIKKEILNILGMGSSVSKWFIYTPLLKRILESSIIDSKENKDTEVSVEHLFSSMLEEGEGVAIRIMLGLKINLDELQNEFTSKILPSIKNKKNKKLYLDELAINLNNKAINNELDPVIGREEEINRVIEILLRRNKNNPTLIGEAGVGKTAIVEELARRIVNNEVPSELRTKIIYSMDMASMVAGTKYRGEFEERLRKVIKEIESNNDIILFIDEIHTLVGAGGAEGAIDASNIFKPSLARGTIKCIGATTLDEYKKFIEKDSALDRRFQKVIVEVPSKSTVLDILYKLSPLYESFHNVSIPKDIIKTIVELSEKYIYDRNEPDRSIDILDEVLSKVKLKQDSESNILFELNKELMDIKGKKKQCIISNDFTKASKLKEKEDSISSKINEIELKNMNVTKIKEVTLNDVAEVISIRTKIPVFEIKNDNVKIIKNMKNTLSKAIIGQDKAIGELINIAKRIKLGYKDNNLPYSFIFAGSTGIGKTYLAKCFGELLVGEANVIKLDMSEYTDSFHITKIIGSPPGYVGYQDNNNILDSIKNKPNSVLIVDEIEKCHPTILNLFLQILDDGKIKDSNSKEVRFDNVTIIFTTNLGFNKNKVGFNKDIEKHVASSIKEFINIEFINRIDQIITFNSLNKKDLTKIVQNSLTKLKNKFSEKDITVTINKKVIDEIINESEYNLYGARKVNKIIKDKLETIIIDEIIENKTIINIDSIYNNDLITN